MSITSGQFFMKGSFVNVLVKIKILNLKVLGHLTQQSMVIRSMVIRTKAVCWPPTSRSVLAKLPNRAPTPPSKRGGRGNSSTLIRQHR